MCAKKPNGCRTSLQLIRALFHLLIAEQKNVDDPIPREFGKLQEKIVKGLCNIVLALEVYKTLIDYMYSHTMNGRILHRVKNIRLNLFMTIIFLNFDIFCTAIFKFGIVTKPM